MEQRLTGGIVAEITKEALKYTSKVEGQALATWGFSKTDVETALHELKAYRACFPLERAQELAEAERAVCCASADISQSRIEIFKQINLERARQDEKWGYPQDNTYCEWSSILAEECGELAKELNEANFGRGDRQAIVTEAVHVAAVAVSIMEQLQHADKVTAACYAYRKAGGGEKAK